MPYDLMHIGTPHGESRQGTPAPLSARARVLRDILLVFGLEPGPAVDVPGLAGRLETAAHPNPFNPKITITFTLPRPGEVSVNIYTIRGELVRTVIDGARFEAGDHPVVWEGDDDSGRPVASGVYFYEVQASGQRRVGKMALVK